jgi:two-component system, OmpR family, response regulator
LLTSRELALLEPLLRRRGATISKTALETSIYAMDKEIRSNVIEAHISRLRKKLAVAGAAVEIDTIAGVGYLLQEVSALG